MTNTEKNNDGTAKPIAEAKTNAEQPNISNHEQFNTHLHEKKN